MKQENRTITYLLKFSGTSAFGSVCSFVHDHAVFKLIDLLAKLEGTASYHIDRVSCGAADKLAVEYSEAQVSFGVPAEVTDTQLRETLDRLIAETGYTGISYEVVCE